MTDAAAVDVDDGYCLPGLTNVPCVAKASFVVTDVSDDGETAMPDCSADNVECYTNPLTGKGTILETDDTCAVQTAGSVGEASGSAADPDEYDYPLGLMDFKLNCGTPGYTATVTQTYFGADDNANYVMRKYNPSVAANDQYSTIDDAVINRATINSQSALQITYTITDGGALDLDGLANGLIVDPAGPAVLASEINTGAPNTGFMMTEQSMSAAGILVLAGVVALVSRRKRSH